MRAGQLQLSVAATLTRLPRLSLSLYHTPPASATNSARFALDSTGNVTYGTTKYCYLLPQQMILFE